MQITTITYTKNILTRSGNIQESYTVNAHVDTSDTELNLLACFNTLREKLEVQRLQEDHPNNTNGH